ncbi:hypothetical protein EGM51_04625 [Verrucomicrobia bacterium S94]|nr:hypothetical protein EGM51_04625 [Verrucomicrobia bacterium S94]
MDAGNSEYPVVWDQSNLWLEGCLLDGTGFGLGSKCSNVTVTNCHFKGYRMDVDMLHIEEFGYNFVIVDNTFEHVSPARSIYIDRELQPNHSIRIEDNTWFGEYGWIISCYSPEGVIFRNNDFSGAWASDTNFATIDFTYLHTSSEAAYLPYDLPCADIIFTNNTGLTAAKDGYLVYQSLYGDTSIQIDYPKIQHRVVLEQPRAVFSPYRQYRIKNRQSGEYIAAIDGTDELGLISGAASDGSDLGLPADLMVSGSEVVLKVTNAPAKSWFALLSKTNLHDAVWTTNRTDLPIGGLGVGSVTNSITQPQEFYMLVETEAPPVPVIAFTAPDYTNGLLNLHPRWNTETGWMVGDAEGSGHILTEGNSEAALLNEPVVLTPGRQYRLSINLQFGGFYSTPSNWVYAFLGGLKPDNTGASVGTAEASAADANIQISATDSYRLLNNYSQIGSKIENGVLNAGDVLQFDYELTMGLNADGTFYTVRLQNLTDGTDTGLGTVNGVDQALYSALSGSGAYGFFQSINPGNNGSGLSGVQVNSVTVEY